MTNGFTDRTSRHEHSTAPMRYTKSLIGVVCLRDAVPCAYADDWPQWQGPNRNAISKETGLLKEWPKDGPPLAWKITGTRRRRQRSVHRRRADLRHEPIAARTKSFGPCPRRTARTLWVSRLGPAFAQRTSQGKEGPGVHADGRWRPALCRGPGRRRVLPAGQRRQNHLAAQPDARFWRARAHVELPRIAAGRWRQGHLHPRRRRTRCWWPSTS